MKPVNIHWAEKAATAKTASCIIKMLPAKKWRALYLKELKKHSNIKFINYCFVVDIITQHHLGYLVTKSTPDITCYGVYVLNLN